MLAQEANNLFLFWIHSLVQKKKRKKIVTFCFEKELIECVIAIEDLKLLSQSIIMLSLLPNSRVRSSSLHKIIKKK
jgi:hypothetical protein